MTKSKTIWFSLLLLIFVTQVSAENPPSLQWKAPGAEAPGLCNGKSEDPLSFSALPKNIAGSFGALFCPDNATPFYVAVGSTLAAFSLDNGVKSFFGLQDRFEMAGNVGAAMGKSYYVAGAVGGIFLAGNLINDTRFRSFSYSLAQGFIINNGIVIGTKYAVGRERPDGSNSLSFLSGHTANSFLFATIASHYYPKLTIPAYLAASFVGLSRMERNVHHFSDVVAGAALGYIVGRTVARRNDGVLEEKKVQWMPVVSPSTKAVGLSMAIQF